MRVVTVGARPEAMATLLAAGHEVTVLFENTARNRERLAGFRHRLSGTCVVDSVTDVASLWSALCHLGVERAIDVVVPTLEQAVVAAAVLASLVGARSMPPGTALRCRDKALQDEAWNAAGVRTARHAVVTDPTAGRAAVQGTAEAAGLKAPLVVKPVAGYGAMHTFVVDDRDHLAAAVAEVVERYPNVGRLLVEERDPGAEWLFDGLITDGKLRWIMVSRFLNPIVDCGLTVPFRKIVFPPAVAGHYRAAKAFSLDALRALDVRDAVFHFEVFGGPDGFAAGELAVRPGGQLVPALVRHMIGVDVWECFVKSLTRDEIPPPPPPLGHYLGYIALPITPGRVNRLCADDLWAVPGAIEVEMSVLTGALMPEARDSSSVRVAGLIVQGPTEEGCAAALEQALKVVMAANG